ncbi:MAG: hypothetical protein ABWW65_00765 [Thermoprotei archaeon]
MCSSATIIVFGGRGDPSKLYSTEPRDLDLLVITSEPIEYVEEKIRSLKPLKLPLDLIVINKDEFNPDNPLIKKMLEKSYMVCDGLNVIKKQLNIM